VPPINKLRTSLSPAGRFSGRRPAALPAPERALVRLRTALTVFFALDGFLFAGWVVRIPAVKAQTGASASALGLALLGVSAGAVATMVLTGRLCAHFGAHRVTVGSAALVCVGVALPPLTRSALALGLVLLVFGAAYGAINVAMNSAAVDLIAALRRPVMPSFHAAFSIGGMLGAALGGLLAGRLSALSHLGLLAVVGLAATAAAGRVLLAQPVPQAPRAADRESEQETARRPPAAATGDWSSGWDWSRCARPTARGRWRTGARCT
jgi:MFS family permease